MCRSYIRETITTVVYPQKLQNWSSFIGTASSKQNFRRKQLPGIEVAFNTARRSNSDNNTSTYIVHMICCTYDDVLVCYWIDKHVCMHANVYERDIDLWFHRYFAQKKTTNKRTNSERKMLVCPRKEQQIERVWFDYDFFLLAFASASSIIHHQFCSSLVPYIFCVYLSENSVRCVCARARVNALNRRFFCSTVELNII